VNFRIGRYRIRPFSFALMLSLIVSAWQWQVLHAGPGSVFGDIASGCFALIAAALLFAGWAWDNGRVHRWGMLLATGVWTARAFLAFMDPERAWTSSASGWLSLCWAIAAGGTWLVERHAHRIELARIEQNL
jgi:hypothetical protein